jgi:hypothetical protein
MDRIEPLELDERKIIARRCRFAFDLSLRAKKAQGLQARFWLRSESSWLDRSQLAAIAPPSESLGSSQRWLLPGGEGSFWRRADIRRERHVREGPSTDNRLIMTAE